MGDYAKIPAGAKLDVKPFKAHVDEAKLQLFKNLLELSPIGPAVYENTNAGQVYGIERCWLENAKKVWLNDFDWRKQEDRINSFPNFKASVKDAEDNVIELHFLALFSEKADAVPIAFFHGWPGNICEFLGVLDLLRTKYTPEELPYHIIVPSLPGYAYSSGPPVDKDYRIDLAASAMNNLMVGLGFESGYIAQGGDLGSFISRHLALTYDACKGMHVNMMGIPPIENMDDLDEEQKLTLQKASEVIDTGMAFALEQGTRPATIGLALSASPLALLCWIGEKLRESSWGHRHSLETILQFVTLYWMTDTAPRAMWHNRGLLGDPNETPRIARISALTGRMPLKLPFVEKPCGYSKFAGEIIPVPKSWAEKSCNLVSFREHESGGHFAALEKPAELLEDVEEYVRVAWRA